MPPSSPAKLVEEAAKESLGYNPCYGSIKPVHLANGLFRAIIGGFYDTTPLNQVAQLWRELNKPALRIPLACQRVIDSCFDDEAKRPEGLAAISAIVEAAYGTDGALYRSSHFSSLSTACGLAVTRDPSHRGTGDFIFWVLGGLQSTAVSWIEELLRDIQDPDPWTLLALPLLLYDQEFSGSAAPDVAFVRPPTGLVSILRECFERLISFEREQCRKLNSLRRIVLFSCFAVYLDLVSRYAEETPDHPVRPPILIDTRAGGRSIEVASHDTFRAAQRIVECYFRKIVADWLIQREGVQPTSHSDVEAALDRYSREDPLVRDLYNALETLDGPDDDAPFDRLVRALVFRGFSTGVDTPMSFLRELGRRAGFLGPWSGRGDRKRYLVSSDFIEVLVLSLVSRGETIYFGEFLQRLFDSFGILVGREEDIDIVNRNNIYAEPFGLPTIVSEDALRKNKEGLRQHLEELGYAVSYADGVTIVTVP